MAAAVLVALAAGCGGAGGAGAEIGKAAFLEKADAICRASTRTIVKKSLAALREGSAAGESRHDVETAAVATVLIPALVAEVQDIHALGAPSGDDDRVQAILDAIEEAIEEARVDPQSYVQIGGHYLPGSHHYGKAARLATAYGLTDCPQG